MPKPLGSLGVLTIDTCFSLFGPRNFPLLKTLMFDFVCSGLPVHQAHKFVLDNTVMVGKWLYVGPVISVMSLLTDLCEMKISPAMLINKKCHSHQRVLTSNVNEVSQNFDPADATIPHMTAESWRMQESKVNKETGLVWMAGCLWRGWLSEPRGLCTPCRMLNSLTWYWSLMIRLPVPFVANLYTAWLPLASLEQFLRATEMLSLGLGDSETPKHYHK